MSTNPQPRHRYLTSILLEVGLVTEEQVEEALFRQRATGHRVGETLVEMGAVTEESIGWALARQFSLVFVDLPPESLDPELVKSFPEELLRRLQAVPLVRTEAGLSMAVADPTAGEALSELVRAAGCPLTVSIATPSRVRDALDTILGARHGRPPELADAAPSRARYDVIWDRSGATFLDFHLANAGKLGASEIHFIPDHGELHIAYRVGADLVTEAVEPVEVLDLLLARLHALGGPGLTDADPHVRGHVLCRVAGEELRVEASIVRCSEAAAVTLFPTRPAGAFPSLEDLGLEPADVERLRAALRQPAGLVLLAGPPRCGASTTLAALLAATPDLRRRALLFEPDETAWAPLVSRVHLDPARARETWKGVAVSMAADVVALDGVLAAEQVAEALGDAAAGRLLLVRTDWTDSFALLAHLASRPRLRPALSRRLLAVLQQRLVYTGPAAHGEKEERRAGGGGRAALFEAVFPGEGLRRALAEGADEDGIRAAAGQDGCRTLSEAADRWVAEGRLSPGEAARALS